MPTAPVTLTIRLTGAVALTRAGRRWARRLNRVAHMETPRASAMHAAYDHRRRARRRRARR